MASDLIIEAGDRTEEEEGGEEEEDDRYTEISEIRDSDRSEVSAWSSSFYSRSHSTTPRTRPSSPRSPVGFRESFFVGSHGSSPSRFSDAQRPYYSSRSPFQLGFNFNGGWWKSKFIEFWLERKQQPLQQQRVKRKAGRVWLRKRSGLLVIIGLLCFYFFMGWWMLSRLPDNRLTTRDGRDSFVYRNSSPIHGGWSMSPKKRRPEKLLYARMLALAAHALAEGEEKSEPKDFWEEPLIPASAWTPCADQGNWGLSADGNNGYIIVTANGGMNQQRVAVCNIVAVARLLNATLVVPNFLYSSVWRDVSQFSDLYQEEHFINYLKPDIRIVKELPVELQSLDLEAIGSVVTDMDIMKEAKPSFFLKHILPILLRNKVVHFVGFGNRLAFDPIPFQLQRLRCRCNFHALEFVPKIQEAGALIIQRLRHHKSHQGPLDHKLVGLPTQPNTLGRKEPPSKSSRYLALHLRFEIDMVAHSLCEFGGGEEETEELEAYRSIHFPALTHLKKTSKVPSAMELRTEGKCPLTPEEAALMLAALGVNRKRHIFLAGSQIYGGKSRMRALTNLYPNLVTKENLLSPSEIEPFTNFSSQLAALDFIGCAAADAFSMTDSGSQFSSLVAGYRMYYGGGRMPSIRPNKRRLSSIFLKNSTIEWKEFEHRVRKAVKQSKQVQERPPGRSIYRHPRCFECMCNIDRENPNASARK